MSDTHNIDETHMARAIEIARRGDMATSPNPMVGAVVVAADGAVVGEGWHVRPGGAHGEVVALEAAGDAARGATLYVNLEPCSHWGRTPPCTDAILKAGLARVVYACDDPNPTAKGGAAILREAGLAVTSGVLRAQGRRLNRAFFSLVERARPWVVAKFAASLDGRIATRGGESQWITGPKARAHAHILRAWSDVVMVGSGTAVADDPRLDARTDPPPERAPMRLVVDSRGALKPEARLFEREVAGPALVATTPNSSPKRRDQWATAGAQILIIGADGRGRVDLAELMRALAKRGAARVLAEGGPALLGALFDAGLVDEVVVHLAPLVIGGEAARSAVEGRGVAALADAKRLRDVQIEEAGGDIIMRGEVMRAGVDACGEAA